MTEFYPRHIKLDVSAFKMLQNQKTFILPLQRLPTGIKGWREGLLRFLGVLTHTLTRQVTHFARRIV
jgi:hypothetical protein